jgi:hypothetical protein
MIKITILLFVLFLTGCSSLQKKKQSLPPSVSTNELIESLTETKTELQLAGDANTKVAENINKALSLAQRLDSLLEQIEKEQNNTSNKNIIK